MKNQEPARPNPDDLLVKANEDGRGKLKIFSAPVLASEKPTPCYKRLNACVHKG